MTRRMIAWTLLITGYLLPLATLAAGLWRGWLTPHGDGIPGLLLSIAGMIVLAGLAANILGPARDTAVEDRRAASVLRRLAVAGAVVPLALLIVLLLWVAVGESR